MGFTLQILFDFQQVFKDEELDDFEHMWTLHKEKMPMILQSHNVHKDFSTVFSDEIGQILMLLKLLPLRARNVQNRLPFSQAIQKIVVFAKVR